MPSRTSPAELGPAPVQAPPVKVAIVTLDHHLAGHAERAAARFQARGLPIEIAFHAAADWEEEPARLEACRADIARADIIVAAMLFLDSHIQAIRPALEARRASCDALVGMLSGAEIVRLTKLGAFRMDAEPKGPLALLRKLRGSAKPGRSSGEGQMRLLRALPRLLRWLPGSAQDARAYFLTLQYWLAGSDENFAAMILALVDRYAQAERAAWRGRLSPPPPRAYPEVGVYHPDMVGRIAETARCLPRPSRPRGTVGLILLRSYVLGDDCAHYDGVIRALEAQGLAVIPAFASGLDQRAAIERFFMARGRATIDALVSLTGFSLVGGPAYNDAQAAEDVLAALDVPYVSALPLEFQTLEAWGRGRRGLAPVETTMMVAIPELDGAIAPMVIGGRSDGTGEPCTGCGRRCRHPAGVPRAMHSCPERAEALARRVRRLVELRHTPPAERRLAISLFNFPPGAGAVGTAAWLAVFESLHRTLQALARAGYRVEVPATVDELRHRLLEGNRRLFGTDANVVARIPADAHVRREPHLAAIEAQWGPAPGRQLSDGRSILVLGERFGNVLVGIQPPFGYEGDPMRLLFDGRFAPTHAFAAYHRFLREEFGAHAVLHFGTHGALEFMPGKQVGLSGDCWPERLLGDLPNVYLYAANNPSEGAVARRRSAATLVSYRTPPLAAAGLHRELADLKATLDRWRATPADAPERARLEEAIRTLADAQGLGDVPPEGLSARLQEVEATLVPMGLHTLDDAEVEAVLHALDGGYIRPAPGADPSVHPGIPTGRNIHGFDPFRLPSAFAVQEGARQARELLDRHVGATGRFPRSVAMVLWGTDNLKTEGVAIAQALALMGARPRRDGYGRLAGAELVPLHELGRPRIDVVMTLSGIARDLLPLQVRMLAEAAWLAATADEPEDLNFLRAHALAQVAATGCDLETAALRVFSNAEGAYGANVNLMIDNGSWTTPDDLADSFERQKGYAYGRSGRPVRRPDVLKAALGRVELAYQNLESVELGVTTIDQYVDTLGGIARSVARARGQPAAVYILDGTGAAPRVRTLAEQIALESRTRTLNPAWVEAMLTHGHEGVRNIEAQVTVTMGWSATTGEVAPWIFRSVAETFVLDADMRERLTRLNPEAARRLADRLVEAVDRELWRPDPGLLAALRAAAEALEDRLEGIAEAA
ncbi:MAG: cobaltochelatase subunit CobN [Sphingomonadaceae bacterium]|uniref:cobaltochelatase subunit CobN n=1 Tax=Thermaurantiacus sp. TaxID=2820283 RepID=UPI00298F23CB|nr:cobaltochelatase subunit CobN [Thermaurantiacus sp.]MCS6987802.1 cobaltochelatase subunit CobN [Sphingomonadaceae bacterium]MDW8414978.1 cobaltochelatase subunit CobN [Thermaurantiacus sp.]